MKEERLFILHEEMIELQVEFRMPARYAVNVSSDLSDECHVITPK
jgi:hypothetical protein